MRSSLILLSVCLKQGVAASTEESSSLIQLKSRQQQEVVAPNPAKQECKTACKTACCDDKQCGSDEICKKNCNKKCKSAWIGKTCTSYALIPKAKKCRRTWKNACLAALKHSEKEGELAAQIMWACKKTSKKSWSGTACTAFTASAVDPAKLCQRAWKKMCAKDQGCTALEGDAKTTCMKACGKSSQTAFTGGKCTMYTPPTTGYEPAPAPVPVPEPEHVCGKWSEWSECTATCGGGLQTAKYSFIDGNKCNHPDCPHGDGDLKQQACNTQPCAVDCVGEWLEYGPCSASCGGGVQERTYQITQEALHGGKACPKANGAVEAHKCSTEQCEQDCKGHWDDWTDCVGPNDAWCGPGGEQSRNYIVETKQTSGGCECQAKTWGSEVLGVVDASTIDTRSCDLPCCPVNCVGKWGEWGTCTGDNVKTIEVEGGYGETTCCGGGKKKRTFSVSVEKECGGACCAASNGQVDEDDCCTAPCPVDCVGDWSEWGTCTSTCGGGQRTRTFQVTVSAEHGGKQCKHPEDHVETEPCNTQGCPRPCKGEWLPWGSCSVSCAHTPGEGTQTREFKVLEIALNGGEPCQDMGKCDVRPCDPEPTGCPEDAFCEWSEWGDCSDTCRPDEDHVPRQRRSWIEITPAKNGGIECKGNPPSDGYGDPSIRVCPNIPRCPEDCEGHWTNYSSCSADKANPGQCDKPRGHFCGGGNKIRHWIVTKPARFGGKECPKEHMHEDTKQCGECECPTACEGEWSAWSQCGATCGGSSQESIYKITKKATNGGCECPHKDGEKKHQNCGEVCCPVDCEGSWGEFGSCSEECQDCKGYGAIGTQQRKFSVSVKAECGGKTCAYQDGQVDEQTCNDHCCPEDCVGDWTEFGECSTSCGSGTRKQTFTISEPARYGGKKCDYQEGCTNTEACPDTTPCPIHCQGEWDSVWGHCTAECGVNDNKGIQKKHFIEFVQAQNGGDECQLGDVETQTSEFGTKYQTRECTKPESKCPKCIGYWSTWSKCSATCGPNGKKTRTFTVHREAVGGPACKFADGEIQTESCNTHVDCPKGYVCPPGEDCGTSPY